MCQSRGGSLPNELVHRTMLSHFIIGGRSEKNVVGVAYDFYGGDF